MSIFENFLTVGLMVIPTVAVIGNIAVDLMDGKF